MGFLGRFVGKGDATAPKGLPRTNPAVANRIKNILGIRELESMPLQAARAFQLASDPKSNAADFIKVVEHDEALSSKIIRVANSVYFFRGTKATDIEKAVANIGLDELRCLLTASMLKSMLLAKHPLRKQLWSNAVATAICCKNLSRYTDHVSSGEAFLCGLVHDIGKLVMIRKHGALYERVVARVSSGERTYIEAEEEFFETNHVEVGKWVGEHWNFPDSVILAIAKHHEPWPTDPKLQKRFTTVATLVKIGDTIAHSKGIGHPPAFRGFQKVAQENLPKAFSQVGLTEELGNSFIEGFMKQFEDDSSMFEMDV